MHFDGAIFDMDGVITHTASVHFHAWKETFDAFLASDRADAFTRADYLAHVDGRPRYMGVEAFLQSRNLHLPFGAPNDPAGAATICGLGNRKNVLFNEIVEENGVVVFDSTLALIGELRRGGIKVAVATSSKNGERILKKAGLTDLFDGHVDGADAEARGLKGKPEPDLFRAASDAIGVAPRRTLVVEDAQAGVEAGVRGGFGLVLGVARENNEAALHRAGADIVVTDLAEISLAQIDRLFHERDMKRARTCGTVRA
ncbi:MAG: beta-phosphoglucomutase family hydrolase [Rhizomicrobium sp.]